MPNNPNMLGYPGMPGMLAPQEEEGLPGMLNANQPRSLERLRQRVTQARGPGWDIPYSEANPEMPGLGFTEAPTPLQMFSMQLGSPFEADRGEAALESIKYAVDAVIPAGLGAMAWQALKGKKAMPPLSGQFGGPAFTGSRHKYGPDVPGNERPDMSKIGTGEGAQAYGHGLYYAENRAVGAGYRQAGTMGGGGLPVGTVELGGGEMLSPTSTSSVGGVPARFWRRLAKAKDKGLSPDEAVDAALEWVPGERWSDGMRAPLGDKMRRTLADPIHPAQWDDIKEHGAGYLYEVDIPDEQIAQMLDWDKPLMYQPPAVKKALRERLTGDTAKQFDFDKLETRKADIMHEMNAMFEEYAQEGDRAFVDAVKRAPEPTKAQFFELSREAQDIDAHLRNGMSGESFYESLVQELGGQREASEFLRESGIPGIKYLDQGSRSAGEGTRNLVMFDEKDITMLRRNETEFPRNK